MKVPVRVALWCAVLFVYAMAGHGELARRRPEPAGLTGYYLAIAAGGALGGLLNAIVAPLLFTGYWELHLGILAGPLVVLLAVATADSSSPGQPELLGMRRRTKLPAGHGRRAAAAGRGRPGDPRPGAGPWPWTSWAQDRGVLRASRGFYGVLRVVREEPGQPDEYVKLLHGQITHGLQLSAPARRAELTTYYGPSSGAGLAIRRHPKRLAGRPMRVGVIGLGVGTLAAWSRPGDVVPLLRDRSRGGAPLRGRAPGLLVPARRPGRAERQPGRRPPRARERGASGLRRAGGGRLQQRRDTHPPPHARGLRRLPPPPGGGWRSRRARDEPLPGPEAGGPRGRRAARAARGARPVGRDAASCGRPTGWW